jgi:hypothetical protein
MLQLFGMKSGVLFINLTKSKGVDFRLYITILEKESTCPIPTCKKRTKKLKHHCWDYHLPFIFKDKVEETLENDPEFQKLTAEALAILFISYRRKHYT